jgi:hypothetical protein
MRIDMMAAIALVLCVTGCGMRSATTSTNPPAKPVIPIAPADAPSVVDSTMNFVFLDLIQPARTKIADLHQTPNAVQQEFPNFSAWLMDVSACIRMDTGGQRSIQHGTLGMQELIGFSGIHYQCDTQAGCHDLLGAAAAAESAKLNNAAKALIDHFHGQSEEARKAAADYFEGHFSLASIP